MGIKIPEERESKWEETEIHSCLCVRVVVGQGGGGGGPEVEAQGWGPRLRDGAGGPGMAVRLT